MQFRLILAIETSGSRCEIAIGTDNSTASTWSAQGVRAHAENLAPLIKEAMGDLQISPQEITDVAVSAGPGSYTGLRIGVASAKGFAMAANARLVGVNTLQAIACESAASRGKASAARLMVTRHARETEHYVQCFELDAGVPVAASEPQVLLWSEIQQLCAEEPWQLCTDVDPLTGTRIADSSAVVQPTAKAVLELGIRRAKKNDHDDLYTFEPSYLKDFVGRKKKGTALDKLSF